MAPLGRMLITMGLVLVVFGLLVTFAGRLPFRFGRLPGDIVWHGRNSTFYFPLATCILLSVIFSLMMWLFRR
jgi:ribose/xylose/arabinose/galactoside ABC-type transport system permease subunit